MKNFIIGAIVVLIAVAAGALGQSHFSASASRTLSASAGPEFSNRAVFQDDAIIGGSVFATSSIGTATYTGSSFVNNKLIQHTAASALTATLPASTTLTAIAPRPGDTFTRFLAPITTGITLAGGTGTDLDTASSTKFCVAGAVCKLDFVRKSNSDFEVLLTSGL